MAASPRRGRTTRCSRAATRGSTPDSTDCRWSVTASPARSPRPNSARAPPRVPKHKRAEIAFSPYHSRSLGMTLPFREIRAARLADEVGTIHKQGELPFALCYPSPYAVGMSSLGFQTIYRSLNALPGVAAERAFLPDDARAARASGEPLRTYESMRPVGDFPVVAFSLAYELELAGLCDCLDLAGIPLFAEERAGRPDRHPLVIIGGPLTFSNPVPAAPYADVLLLGEAEETIVELVETMRSSSSRAALLETLAS